MIQYYTFISYGEGYITDNPSRTILYFQLLFEQCYFVAGYTFVTMQLYLALKGSQFALPKCIISMHVILIMTIVIGNLVRFIIYFATDIFDEMVIQIYVQRILGAVVIFGAFIGLSHISYIFNRKLYLFVVHIHGNQSSLNININEESHQRIFKVITKISLLMTTMIIFAILRVTFGVIDGLTDSEYSTVMFFYAHTIYKMMMTLYVFLTISINENIYAALCKICDQQCINLCKRLAVLKATESVKMRQNIKYVGNHMHLNVSAINTGIGNQSLELNTEMQHIEVHDGNCMHGTLVG